MKTARWTCALALLVVSPPLFAGSADGITIAHFEPVERLRFDRSGVVMTQKPEVFAPVDLRFDAMGRSFDLELEPNTALLSGSSRTALGNGIGVYRGRIAGNVESWARIVVADGVPRGLIWDGRELFALEAPDDSAVNATGPVIYRLADVSVAPGSLSCGSGESMSSGKAMYEAVVGELQTIMQAQGPGAVEEIMLGAVGDFEFTTSIVNLGGNADAAIMTRLNNVDGIFSQQLGVQITAAVVRTFSDPMDPFSDETDSGMLLTELSDYRFNTPEQNQQGLTHLFTGKNLDSSTAGVAFVGALCSARFGAGLAEATRGAAIDSLVSAHEIGHNFNAEHDGDPAGSCPDEPETFIMAPAVGPTNNTFSPCSVAVMRAAADMAACITPLPSVDMTVGTTGQPTSVLLGNAVNITFDVTNNGTIGATGVTADISLPSNVSFVAASASQGSCTSGASTVSCAIGNVGGGSGGTVTVTADTVAVGPASFTATVSADTDDNDNNNQTVHQVTIQPAVNLEVGGLTAAQLTVNQSTNLSASLDNTATLEATGVTVSVSLDAGIRADSASWTAGSCTVAAQQVDCTAAALGAQSMSTLTVGITAVTAGTQGYTVTMAANEADAVPSNDSASGTVSVSSVSANSGGDDGGGAFGTLFVAILGGLAARRRVRA